MDLAHILASLKWLAWEGCASGPKTQGEAWEIGDGLEKSHPLPICLQQNAKLLRSAQREDRDEHLAPTLHTCMHLTWTSQMAHQKVELRASMWMENKIMTLPIGQEKRRKTGGAPVEETLAPEPVSSRGWWWHRWIQRWRGAARGRQLTSRFGEIAWNWTQHGRGQIIIQEQKSNGLNNKHFTHLKRQITEVAGKINMKENVGWLLSTV